MGCHQHTHQPQQSVRRQSFPVSRITYGSTDKVQDLQAATLQQTWWFTAISLSHTVSKLKQADA